MKASSNQLPSSAETEFKQRLKAATNLRRKWVYASEVAGGLCHAAKALRKVGDPERRFDLLCDFIFKGNEMLKNVDDSNASLQSVYWNGDVASELWKETAPHVGDKEKIVRFCLRLFDEGWDRIAIQALLEWPSLYLPEKELLELRDSLLARSRTTKNTWDKRQGKDLAAKVWAQCGDLDKFDEFVRKELRLRPQDFWHERLAILEVNRRWDEAIALCRESESGPYGLRLILEIARKKGDPETLRSAYAEALDAHLDAKTVREAKQELPDEAFSELLRHVFDHGSPSPFLNPEYATILLEFATRECLHKYILDHAGDNVCDMRAITGFFPLGTALAKAGEPLLATVPIRIGIEYLMVQCNSKYYPTVHRKMDELSELATRISNWENIPSHDAFFTDFKRSFASRYSFW